MADYISHVRSNYFEVSDAKALEALIQPTALELWSQKGKNNETLYAFGTSDCSLGAAIDWNEELQGDDPTVLMDVFTQNLQAILKPGNAIVIEEIGHEALRYLCATAIVITKEQIKWVDLEDVCFNAIMEDESVSKNFVLDIEY